MNAAIADIRSDIQFVEDNAALYKETNFNSRANAIDFIEFHIIGRLESLPECADVNALKQHAEKLKRSLEDIDTNLFKRLRDNIRAGLYTGASFTEMVQQYTAFDRTGPDTIGYDNLDLFMNGLLTDQPIPETTAGLEPDMVFYQKTPARLVFQLAAMAQLMPGDVFYDIGSGLGQVAILMHLISGAKCQGIEYEPAYHAYAEACATQLNLSQVGFINDDARNVDFADGTVFFLYSPFLGALLQQVLDRLQQEAQKRAIRVFSYGPCSAHIDRQSWVHYVNGRANDGHSLCEFKSL
jgi:hypothetical protein